MLPLHHTTVRRNSINWLLRLQSTATTCYPRTLDPLDTLCSITECTEGAGLGGTLHLPCREMLLHFPDHCCKFLVVSAPFLLLPASESNKQSPIELEIATPAGHPFWTGISSRGLTCRVAPFNCVLTCRICPVLHTCTTVVRLWGPFTLVESNQKQSLCKTGACHGISL